MANFTFTGFSTVGQTLNGSEMGFIGPNGGISVDGADAVTATSGTNWLTVLGFLNGYDGGFSAVDAGGSVFEMAIGPNGYVTAENPSNGVLDIDVTTSFTLFNEGTIYSSNDRAIEVNDTDDAVSVNIYNEGSIRSNTGEAVYVDSGDGPIDFNNAGNIYSTGEAVQLFRTFDATGTVDVINTGIVTSNSDDAFLVDQGVGSFGAFASTFFNSGTIIGDENAIDFADAGPIELVNTGTLISNLGIAVESEAGDDVITNTGLIVGDIDTGSGSDTIDTRDGEVRGTIFGGDDSDTYLVGEETQAVSETISGGAFDIVRADSGFVLPLYFESLVLEGISDTRGAGNSGANSITGNNGDNALFGFGGEDTLTGLGGDDKIFGGASADTVNGGDGNDWIHGGGGDDSLVGNDGFDTVEGGTGNDTIRTGNSGQFEGGIGRGDQGDDLLLGNEGDETLEGGSGNDLLAGDGGADRLVGGPGIDEISYGGSPGRVVINLGANFFANNDAEGDSATGVENLRGSNFDDVLVGNSSANVIYGQTGEDELRGGSGEDTLQGGFDGDILNGESGADTADYSDSSSRVLVNLSANFADQGYATGDELISIERLVGSNFNDVLVGTSGGNRLFGGSGDDELRGEGAGDLLYGGPGNDELQGDTGADQFIFEITAFGNDTINDFEDGTDIIRFLDLPGINDISDVNIGVDGSDLLVDIGGVDDIRLLGANGSVTLTAADFLFE
ncbi:calcium-binding protein [Cognatishimia sp. F0-27]|uniref:calcium-binding protein n=1 Tax=Cognatishimia sp. F0-27 TaxID=2816855 RepID=UPI001D0C6027|nr:calcium-binding protein [Cognatishimia sp. F0-27]MCC1494753.1 calcium-binding protein [Cognatishimia sp. F0-27]